MVTPTLPDKQIILKYIEKCYSFDNNFQTEFFVIDNKLKIFYRRDNFIKMITKKFGDFTITNGYSVRNVIEEWFDNNVNLVVNEIKDYLNNNLTIKLGPKDWIVLHKKDDKIFNYDELIDLFNHKHNKLLIKSIYQDWYSKSVVKESDRLLNLPWT